MVAKEFADSNVDGQGVGGLGCLGERLVFNGEVADNDLCGGSGSFLKVTTLFSSK